MSLDAVIAAVEADIAATGASYNATQQRWYLHDYTKLEGSGLEAAHDVSTVLARYGIPAVYYANRGWLPSWLVDALYYTRLVDHAVGAEAQLTIVVARFEGMRGAYIVGGRAAAEAWWRAQSS